MKELVGADMVKVELEELSEDDTDVLLAADSSYSHAMFNIVLPDGMMTQVEGPTMIVHSRLCCDVLRSFVVRI